LSARKNKKRGKKNQKKDLTEPTLLEMPQYPNREPVSSPRRFKPIVPISSNGLTCRLPIKDYVTYSAG
jgi:hypothetical protein